MKLGFMSAFAKACTLALKEIPAANASIEGDEIVYRDYVDLSVAVATPKGLVTPVVRNAESLGFVDIEREIAALGKKVCGGAVDSLGVRLRLGGCGTDLGDRQGTGSLRLKIWPGGRLLCGCDSLLLSIPSWRDPQGLLTLALVLSSYRVSVLTRSTSSVRMVVCLARCTALRSSTCHKRLFLVCPVVLFLSPPSLRFH